MEVLDLYKKLDDLRKQGIDIFVKPISEPHNGGTVKDHNGWRKTGKYRFEITVWDDEDYLCKLVYSDDPKRIEQYGLIDDYYKALEMAVELASTLK